MTYEHTALQGDQTVHCEITPKIYYQHYIHAPPSYDLYPALSRRLGNGYHHLRAPPVKRNRPMDFACMNVTNTAVVHPTVLSSEPAPLTWDLYPLVFRNVENFGTDQMRQQLRRAMTTI